MNKIDKVIKTGNWEEFAKLLREYETLVITIKNEHVFTDPKMTKAIDDVLGTDS